MTLVTFFISVVLAGFIGFLLILLKIKDRKSGIPFGPFIVAGTFLTYLFGWDLLNWYLERLFN
jgi:leader peptidase (prepilin peptidase)/N-methyltransferase